MPHLIHPLILFIFLVPCAYQDWVNRHISNWLTIPAFLLACIDAFYLDTVALTVAVFAGCYLAWMLKWMGGADGKLATLMAAVAPGALLVSGALLAATFIALRCQGRTNVHLPAAIWFLAGTGLYLLYILVHPLIFPS